MSEQKHTPEPWTYARIEASPTGAIQPYSPWINGAGPRLVNVDRSYCIHADDMRRIVACVNACAGMKTEELENYKREYVLGMHVADLVKQRDELQADIATIEQEARQMRARMERLESENAELTAQRDDWRTYASKTGEQNVDLKKQRDELLAALNKEAQSQYESGYEINPWITDAIARAKEAA